MNRFFWLLAVVAGLLVAPAALAAQEPAKEKAPKRTPDVIYLPTPQGIVEKMLEIANVKKAVMVVHSQMNQARYQLNQTLNLPVTQEIEPADVSLEDPVYAVADGKIRRYLGNPMAFDVLSEFMVQEGTSRSRELRPRTAK